MRKNVVVVRAGQSSLHQRWLGQPYDSRSFDVVVSYYDQEAFARHEPQTGVKAVFFAGGKWDGLHKTVNHFRDEFADYEYVWLPDDDIEAEAETIDQLFLMMRKYDLKVAQPSLTLDSYFTHFIFLQCHGFTLRKTNYVEIMVPCLSIDVLKAMEPNFQNTLSGFGLDYIWCRIAECGPNNAAILDAISVKHTRPTGASLAKTMEKLRIHPKDEEAKLASSYGITKRITPIVHTALTINHKRVSGKRICGVVMAFFYSMSLIAARGAVPRYTAHSIFRLLRRQLTRPVDLSPLQPVDQHHVTLNTKEDEHQAICTDLQFRTPQRYEKKPWKIFQKKRGVAR